MKYSLCATLLCFAYFSGPVFAATFLPPTQDKYFELGAEVFQQEAPGLRISGAYLMSMGIPSLVSKLGLDLGLQFLSGTRPATEYGFFLESTFHATAAYSAYVKTGLYTLTFSKDEASDDSMATVGIELGVQWDHDRTFWELALGTRYRHPDPERIEVGSDVIEKEWLFYPKIGWVGASDSGTRDPDRSRLSG